MRRPQTDGRVDVCNARRASADVARAAWPTSAGAPSGVLRAATLLRCQWSQYNRGCAPGYVHPRTRELQSLPARLVVSVENFAGDAS